MNIKSENIVIRPDLQVIEGTSDNEPTQMQILKYLVDNIDLEFYPTNIDISYDEFQGFWRWGVDYIDSPYA